MWKIQKGYESISKTFRLPEELTQKLEKLAYENNLSLNQLVIQCLNFAIDNLDNSTEADENNSQKSDSDVSK